MAWRKRALALVLATIGGVAQADVALVIAGPEIERRGLLRSTDLDTRPALRAAGFDVISADVSSVAAMRAALSRLMERIGDEDRVVVHLSGAFAQGGGRAWLLEAEAGPPNLATVDGVGLSIDMVLQVVSELPGAAVVALGRVDEDPALGLGLEAGFGRIEAPQGVTVVRGPSAGIARLVQTRITEPGRALSDLTEGRSGLRLSGYAGPGAFLPEGEARPVAPPDPAEAERAIWQAAQAQDDLAAYHGYLDRYPQGLFAEEARAAIAAIESEPARAARLAEEALDLDRAARREIQRDLTTLEHDPRGVDGIFGAGTRAAIGRFQARNGFPETGYLDRLQIDRLRFQAEARAAQIAADAERTRLEREGQDRAAWQATGSGADEAGLRAYLERFPEGLFAREARSRLTEIAAAADQAAWEAAQRVDSPAAYEGYLARHPEGAFVVQARNRIASLTVPPLPADDPDGSEAEARLDLPQITRMLVERRLEQLGHRPGPIDGTLDRETRAAIARFQGTKGVAETGYLDESTLAQMLADLGGLGGLVQD